MLQQRSTKGVEVIGATTLAPWSCCNVTRVLLQPESVAASQKGVVGTILYYCFKTICMNYLEVILMNSHQLASKGKFLPKYARMNIKVI